jgi:hypothetical protein
MKACPPPRIKGKLVKYWPLYEHVAADPDLNMSDKTLVSYFASWWHTTGEAFPSVVTISKDTGLNERTVRRSIKKLTKLHWIWKTYMRIDGEQTSNLYQPGSKFLGETPRQAKDAFYDELNRPKQGAPKLHWERKTPPKPLDI